MPVNKADNIEVLIKNIRHRISYGQNKEEIIRSLEDDFSIEMIYLAYKSAVILNKHKNEVL